MSELVVGGPLCLLVSRDVVLQALVLICLGTFASTLFAFWLSVHLQNLFERPKARKGRGAKRGRKPKAVVQPELPGIS